MSRGVFGCIAVLLISSGTVFSDSIIIDGKRYSDVLVYDSGNGYVVRLPEDGTTLNVSKENAQSVKITEDYGARDALLMKYEKARKQPIKEPVKKLEPIMESIEESLDTVPEVQVPEDEVKIPAIAKSLTELTSKVPQRKQKTDSVDVSDVLSRVSGQNTSAETSPPSTQEPVFTREEPNTRNDDEDYTPVEDSNQEEYVDTED